MAVNLEQFTCCRRLTAPMQITLSLSRAGSMIPQIMTCSTSFHSLKLCNMSLMCVHFWRCATLAPRRGKAEASHESLTWVIVAILRLLCRVQSLVFMLGRCRDVHSLHFHRPYTCQHEIIEVRLRMNRATFVRRSAFTLLSTY